MNDEDFTSAQPQNFDTMETLPEIPPHPPKRTDGKTQRPMTANNGSKSGSEPDIYAYTDHRAFLRDHFAARKRDNANFSFRVFARQAGFASGSTPKMILDGQRQLTLDSIRKFAKGMNLNKRQTAYFEALVDFSKAKTSEDKAAAAKRIKALAPKYKTAVLDDAYGEYLTDLNLITLREMVQLKEFKEDPLWIGNRLVPHLATDEVKRAFATLNRLGLIKRNAAGRLIPHEPVVSTPAEVTDIDVFSVHRELLKKAEEALAAVPAEKRHNAALTLPVPLRKMEELKNKIVAFQRSLIELVDDGKNDFDEVFHVSVALFPATNVKGRAT